MPRKANTAPEATNGVKPDDAPASGEASTNDQTSQDSQQPSDGGEQTGTILPDQSKPEPPKAGNTNPKATMPPCKTGGGVCC